MTGAPAPRLRAVAIRWLLAIGALFILTPPAAAAAAPVNLLVFCANDLGWGELGCQGNDEIPTPHIDSIATNGVRFTSGYVAATYCSPSRAALLTGRDPNRFGHERNSVARVAGLRRDQVTLATRLKQLGYVTAAIGKWHLGEGVDYRPTAFGFDEFYGKPRNSGYFHPVAFVDSRRSNNVRILAAPMFYSTDACGDRSVDWLEKHKNQAVVSRPSVQRPACSLAGPAEVSRPLSRHLGRPSASLRSGHVSDG